MRGGGDFSWTDSWGGQVVGGWDKRGGGGFQGQIVRGDRLLGEGISEGRRGPTGRGRKDR